MLRLGIILLCFFIFNLNSVNGKKCTSKEALEFIELSSGRSVSFLQQFQDNSCRVKFSDSSRYFIIHVSLKGQ